MKALNISKKFVCFKDEEDEFDDDNLPTCKQVCCWRLIRARKRTQEFHTSIDGLVAFEKSKYQHFVALLMTLNYLLLYGVALAPFILIF